MTLHTNFDWSLNVEHFISFSLGIRDEDFPVLHFYGVQLGHILLKIFFCHQLHPVLFPGSSVPLFYPIPLLF